jgi:hypothetical protein
MYAELPRVHQIAVKVISAVLVLAAAIAGIAFGVAVNRDQAHAEDAPVCAVLCGLSGSGSIGDAGGPLVGAGAGAGSIGHVPTAP